MTLAGSVDKSAILRGLSGWCSWKARLQVGRKNCSN